MVAQLVRLRLTLLANILKRSTWQIIGFAFGALYGLSILAGLVVTTDTMIHGPDFRLAWSSAHDIAAPSIFDSETRLGFAAVDIAVHGQNGRCLVFSGDAGRHVKQAA